VHPFRRACDGWYMDVVAIDALSAAVAFDGAPAHSRPPDLTMHTFGDAFFGPITAFRLLQGVLG
jgi:hypothetical protein